MCCRSIALKNHCKSMKKIGIACRAARRSRARKIRRKLKQAAAGLRCRVAECCMALGQLPQGINANAFFHRWWHNSWHGHGRPCERDGSSQALGGSGPSDEDAHIRGPSVAGAAHTPRRGSRARQQRGPRSATARRAGAAEVGLGGERHFHEIRPIHRHRNSTYLCVLTVTR